MVHAVPNKDIGSPNCASALVTEESTLQSSANMQTILLQRGGVTYAWPVPPNEAQNVRLLSNKILEDPLVAIEALKGSCP